MNNKDLNNILLNVKYDDWNGVATNKTVGIDPHVYPTIKWDVNVCDSNALVTNEFEKFVNERLKEFTDKAVKNAITTNKTEPKNDNKKENNMNNAVKNVLFLAPGYNYAKSVVTNQSKELDRKKIPYNASTEPQNFYIHTERVHIEIVYMDPIKWTPDLFQKRDAVFGKKELVDKAMDLFVRMNIIFPKESLSKYIRNAHAESFRTEPVKPRETYIPEIKNAYFNYPMTVVIWEDGTKTMVRCQEGDVYSAETGLALCIAKKALGNMSNFNNIFRKWVPEDTGPKNHYTVLVEGADFAKAINDETFLDKFRNSLQRAFGYDEV